MSFRPAIAIHSCALRGTLRKRGTVVLGLLVAALAIIVPRWVAADASPRAQLEMAVSYGAGLPCFLVAVITVLLGAAAVASEVETRRIQILMTKPLRAWQLAVGHWSAILAVDAALLGLVLGGMGVSWALIARAGGAGGAGVDEAAERFFTARASVQPVVEPPAEEAVARFVAALAAEEHHGLPPSPRRLESQARARLRSRTLAPGEATELEFRGIPAGSGAAGPILVRYEIFSSSVLDAVWMDVLWEDAASGRVAVQSQALHGVPRTAALPGVAPAADGTLRLRLRNALGTGEKARLVIDPASVELLYPYGSLAMSSLRGFAIILLQLGLLAALGILASCLFTFPTAALAGLFFYLTGLASGFLRETFAIRAAAGPPENLLEWLDRAASNGGELVLSVLPDLSRLDVLTLLADGRAITVRDLAVEGGILVAKAALALGAGAFLLRRRELGAMKGAASLVVLLVSLGAAVGLRQELRRERRELRLEPQAARPGAGGERSLRDRQIILLSSSLGVGRALAIDFLSLRAVHLQENGDFSEAAALARLITTLEPRLPQAWSFQAHNLAFNISPFFPPEERFPWVLRGLRLLLDDALLHNPESGVIHHELAFVFLVKIGHDSEVASPLYRSRLAAIFEPGAVTGELLAAWRILPARWRELEAEHGVPLDLRAAPAHALYWAEAGLAAMGRGAARDPGHVRLLLEDVAVSSLVELFGAGRPLRAGEQGVYIFLPDLRFSVAVERRIRREIEARGPRARLAGEALHLFQAEKAWQLFIHGRVEEARECFAAIPDTVGFAAGSLEELLVERLTRLEERDAAAALDPMLDAAHLLARLGEPELAAGHEALARLLHEAATAAGAPVPSFAAALEASRRRLEAPWPEGRQLPFRLEQLLPRAAEGGR